MNMINKMIVKILQIVVSGMGNCSCGLSVCKRTHDKGFIRRFLLKKKKSLWISFYYQLLVTALFAWKLIFVLSSICPLMGEIYKDPPEPHFSFIVNRNSQIPHFVDLTLNIMAFHRNFHTLFYLLPPQGVETISKNPF